MHLCCRTGKGASKLDTISQMGADFGCQEHEACILYGDEYQ